MKKTLALILTLALSLAALTGCGSKTETPADTNTDNSAQTEAPATLSGSVSTNGSTSMEKVIGALSEQFMADNSGVTVTYDPTGSGAGIEAASNGSADIGLASRALKDEEKAGGLTETIVALDGIAVIVNADSKVEDLTVEQIAKIFTGEITDWSEVGGDAGTISCIGREAGQRHPGRLRVHHRHQGRLQAGSGADLHRRRHRGGCRQPQRHRLRIPLRCGG